MTNIEPAKTFVAKMLAHESREDDMDEMRKLCKPGEFATLTAARILAEELDRISEMDCPVCERKLKPYMEKS